MRTLLLTILIILVSLLVILFVAMIIMIKPNKFRDTSYFGGKKFAHRGLHDREVPENSLRAFLLARENGFGVELDVQMTADGQLVVFHDGNVKRMCGIDANIRDLTYEELKALSLKETEERIPLFADVLEVLDGVDLICEIKADNGLKNYELCEKTYNALMTYKGRFCVESFSPFLMGWFKDNHPEIIRGQLSENFIKTTGFTVTNLFMTELLVNIVSKPDFIAYNHYYKSLGWYMLRLFYKPLWVAWTAKGPKEQESAGKIYDTIIFEKNEADRK